MDIKTLKAHTVAEAEAFAFGLDDTGRQVAVMLREGTAFIMPLDVARMQQMRDGLGRMIEADSASKRVIQQIIGGRKP